MNSSLKFFIAILCPLLISNGLCMASGLEYVLDFVHNNPGEKPYVTKYNDPSYLKSLGYTGAVTHWHVNCAIDYSNFEPGLIDRNSEEFQWICGQANKIDSCLAKFDEVGLAVYPFTDFCVFPKSIWEKYGKEISGGKGNKPDINLPMTRKLLVAQIDAIFSRFPTLDGITLRFGETYLHDTPWHLGDSPIGQDAIADHIKLINILREEICVKRDKKLFYRTWDFGYNFHNNPEFYLAVTNGVEPHPNLIFSIKYQQDDYHRMTPFNPTLGIGHHKQIVESQSRMEAYGKGAHPYYVASGVINGWPETVNEIEFGTHRFTGRRNASDAPRGISDILNRNILDGVMTWSHGGGWQGPYIKHEIWTDLNTFVVSKWAQNPERTEPEIFDEFCQSLGMDSINTLLFRDIAVKSIEGVRKGQLNSFVKNDVWWSRDEFFCASANVPVIKEAFKLGVIDSILHEKQEATLIWDDIENISKKMDIRDKELLDAIRVSCTYGRIKYHLINQMWILMVEKYKYDNNGNCDKEIVSNSISEYDRLWHEWNSLYDNNYLCATLYTDMAFRNKKEGSVGELVEQLRKELSLN